MMTCEKSYKTQTFINSSVKSVVFANKQITSCDTSTHFLWSVARPLPETTKQKNPTRTRQEEFHVTQRSA